MSKFKLFGEFLSEDDNGKGTGKFHKNAAKAIPYADHLHTDSYGHYRLMIAAAACTDKEMPKDYNAWGPLKDNPFAAPYSKADADIVRLARKVCGIKSSPVADNGSAEPSEVHKVSPVHPNPHKKSWRNL